MIIDGEVAVDPPRRAAGAEQPVVAGRAGEVDLARSHQPSHAGADRRSKVTHPLRYRAADPVGTSSGLRDIVAHRRRFGLDPVDAVLHQIADRDDADRSRPPSTTGRCRSRRRVISDSAPSTASSGHRPSAPASVITSLTRRASSPAPRRIGEAVDRRRVRRRRRPRRRPSSTGTAPMRRSASSATASATVWSGADRDHLGAPWSTGWRRWSCVLSRTFGPRERWCPRRGSIDHGTTHHVSETTMTLDEEKQRAAEAAVAGGGRRDARRPRHRLDRRTCGRGARPASARRACASPRSRPARRPRRRRASGGDRGCSISPTWRACDLAIDGVDEIDGRLWAIKGAGGAMLREKAVAASAARMIAIGDSTKRVDAIGRAKLPVEVLPFARSFVVAALESASAPSVEIRDSGSLTDNGNLVADCRFAAIGGSRAARRRPLCDPRRARPRTVPDRDRRRLSLRSERS